MTQTPTSNWLADVIAAMRNLGGDASLKDIYDWIRHNRKDLPRETDAIVRSIIYSHSSDAAAYIQGNADIFRRVSRGLWALRYPDDNTPTHRMSENHWLLHILSEMTPEELQSYSREGDEALLQEVRRRAENARAKYRVKTEDLSFGE